MTVQMKKLRAGAKLPARATAGSAGADLCACLEGESLSLAPGQRAAVPTGLAMALPNAGHVALVFARSGLALRQGLAMANGVGVVDSDYRGELLVPMVNLSAETVTIQNGERIAQMLVVPVALPVFEEVETLEETARGDGGFGSTGKR